jgi:dolichol kinase
MDRRLSSRLVAHGAAVFLLGLAAGFPFAFEILQRFELWPLPWVVTFDPPGDLRAWRMAHMEGILNGVVLFAVAGIGNRVLLSRREQAWTYHGLIVAAWGNTVASILSPVFGARGLTFGGFWNSVSYILFVAAIFGVTIALVLIAKGAIARARTTLPDV